MQKMKDQRPKSLKPTTIHGFAQSGDINAFQRLLLNNPSLLNDRNPVVRSLYLCLSFHIVYSFPSLKRIMPVIVLLIQPEYIFSIVG